MKRKKIFRNRITPLILTGFLVMSNKTMVCFAGDTLYLAGCPDQWPFEYYDAVSNQYRGIIPSLLQLAASKAHISIGYLDPSRRDQRLDLAHNTQIDLFCTIGLSSDSTDAVSSSQFPLLSLHTGQGPLTLTLAYTKSMSEDTRLQLEQALTSIDDATIQGLYLRHAQMNPQKSQMGRYFVFTTGLCFLLIVVLLFLLLGFSKRKRLLERLTTLDETTEGENFAVFQHHYNRCVTTDNREHYALLFLYGGIDAISHIYGYQEAAEVLKLISNACLPLIQSHQEGFTRFHEFHFVCFIRYNSMDHLKQRARAMEDAILSSFSQTEKPYFLDIHMGIYRLKKADHSLLQAIQCSEITMEDAKLHFLNVAIDNEQAEKDAVSGYIMEHEAIRGLIQQEFVMYLQPIVNLNTGAIVAAEALVRWNNPKRGLLLPEDFLKIMKKKQLIGKMNLDIFRQGCTFLKKEQLQGNNLQLLFNFTAENIHDQHFISHLESALAQYQLLPEQIIIQLNQVMEIAQTPAFQEILRALRQRGFWVCLAGLELDKVFLDCITCGVNTIKLRHELIRQLDQPDGLKIMGSIVTLCHDLGLNIICVGVENQEQAKLLVSLGCELASGFHYYYPLSQQTFTNRL